MRIALATAALMLAALPAQADWTQIKSQNDLRAQVLENRYVEPETKAWFTLKRDGSLTGSARGQELTGTWRWKRGVVCYDRRLGGEDLPSNCIAIMVNGNELVTIRDSGKGRQIRYDKQ